MGRKRRLKLARGEDDRGGPRYVTRKVALESPIRAAVVDVSESGMGLESGDPLRVSASYVFRVRLGRRDLGLPGKVEWCRLTGTRRRKGDPYATVYRAGVSFSPGPAHGVWRAQLQSQVESGLQPTSVQVQG